LTSFAHRLITWFRRPGAAVLLLGLLIPAQAMAWYGGGGRYIPWAANPYGWTAVPYYRAPPPQLPYRARYWNRQRPYPLTGYWPGYGGYPAPMSPASHPWQQMGPVPGPPAPLPWQALPGSAADNRWQVYGGMDQAGGVWMAFIYRGNINGLMNGGLAGNSWPGSGMDSAAQPFLRWGGEPLRPPLNNLFQNKRWDADRPA